MLIEINTNTLCYFFFLQFTTKPWNNNTVSAGKMRVNVAPAARPSFTVRGNTRRRIGSNTESIAGPIVSSGH